jgi:hypothetical protein
MGCDGRQRTPSVVPYRRSGLRCVPLFSRCLLVLKGSQMFKCPNCRRTTLFRSRCLHCQRPRDNSAPAEASASPPADSGFDMAGFAVGMATGLPISPVHGFSMGAVIGASMHQSSEPARAETTPDTTTTTTYESSSSSSSNYDSSPSPTFDSSPSIDTSSF